MTDDNETEAPKKRRRRTTLFGNPLIDDAVNDAVDQEVENLASEDDVEVDVVEAEEIESERPISFIYSEPVSETLKSKIKQKLGIGNRMEPMKPWMGHDRWRCTLCGWETFKSDKAKKHMCK